MSLVVTSPSSAYQQYPPYLHDGASPAAGSSWRAEQLILGGAPVPLCPAAAPEHDECGGKAVTGGQLIR